MSDPESLSDAVNEAIAHHRDGRLREAEAIYRRVLDAMPDQPDCLHYLGVIAYQTGHDDQAKPLIERALAQRPTDTNMHNNLGNVLLRMGRLDAAIATFRRAVASGAGSPEAHNNLGNALRLRGSFDEALAACRRAIESRPDYADAHNNLGMVLYEQRRGAEAEAAFRRSVELDPDIVSVHSNLGNAMQMQGKSDAAIDCYRRAIALKPDDAGAHSNLGGVLYLQGKLDEAIAAQRTAIEHAPSDARAHYNLGMALAKNGEHHAAEAAYRHAIDDRPDYADAHNNLALLLQHQGRLDEAVAAYRTLLGIHPDLASAYSNLGMVYKQQERPQAAIKAYREALERDPDLAETHGNLASVLQDEGRWEDALAAYKRCLELKPGHLSALWGSLLVMPILYRTEAEIIEHRARWEQGVDALDAAIDLSTPKRVSEAANAASIMTNFYLNYQGRNDIALQRKFAAVLERIAAAAYPDDTKPIAPRERAANQRIRVGFVSPHLRVHSVYKTHGKWLTGLDADRFEIHAFHTWDKADEATEVVKQRADVFHSLRRYDDLIDMLRAADLDILIYLDIGMDARLQIPAALRLAPVQCAGGGHPVTTGLTTIDYFLSSDLMEPDDGADHYVERLVRLPNLANCYPLPDVPEVDRLQGRGADEIVYLCSHSLFKLLPQFDDLFARIAERVPNSRFWFIEQSSAYVVSLFKERLAAAFAKRGLDAAERCQVHRRMTHREFLALNRRADVLLDTVLWACHNAAFDAIACGLPIVTLPGPTMRARHAYAILKMLNLDELIAADEDDYVEIAVRLGKDKAWRNGRVRKITTNAARIFDDETPIRALEDFLMRVSKPDSAAP